MNRTCTFWLVAASIWASTVAAAEAPWRGGYPEYLPDTRSLHDRLHDHAAPSPDDDETSEPVPVTTVEPDIPRGVAKLNRNGWVLLEFMVGTDGEPFDVEIVAQDYQELFGRSAKHAVRSWRFKPAMLNGEPVERSMILPMQFRRATCGYEIPGLHETSLASPLELPVKAAVGLQNADLVFLPIFDNLIGSPAGSYIHAQKWVSGDVIPLNLEGMNDDLTMNWPKDSASPLEIQPERARIARVIPAGLAGEAARFTDPAGRTLILVYADQKATVRGQSIAGNTTLHHRIDLPGAGFYWVEFRRGADGQYESVMVNDINQPHIALREQ